MITVITPTYNRAHLLERVYFSLEAQTSKDFEWLIVDDGSEDDSEEIVNGFIHEGKIPIRYYKKPNGGKHTAINYGANVAKGDLFWILDSDDSLPSNAIETVIKAFKETKDIENLAGICGLMAHHDGTQIGSDFPKSPMIASSIEMRYDYHVTGDLMEVFKTDVLREFPFPEIVGEKFCPEALVWNRIAQKYKLFCFNKVIYFRDYLDGGLTDNIVRIRAKSPMASMTCYAEMTLLPIPFFSKLKAAINYWRFRFCAKRGEKPTIHPLWTLVVPFAYLMHMRDKKCLK